jgi:hypothetical protein
MLKLRMLLDEGRFIVSPARPDAVLNLPPLVYGDVLPVELSGYQRSQADGSFFDAVDLSGYDIQLAVGDPNSRPSLGFAYVTWDTTISQPIPAGATAAETQALIPWPEIEVTGDPGDWIFSVKTAGEQTAPTVTFEGSTTVTASVTTITDGTESTPAQWRVQLMESAPAGITADAWSSGTTTPDGTVTGSGAIWTVKLAPACTSGFWRLTANGTTTGYLPLTASTLEVKTALEMIGAPCQVMRGTSGGYLIAFAASTTLTLDESQLQIPPTKTAFLNLSTPGIREMLDGATFAPAELTVSLLSESQQVTTAIVGVHLKMPVATPAASSIPIYQRTAFKPLSAYTGETDSLEALRTAGGIITTGSVCFTTVDAVFHTWQLQDGTDATDAAAGYVRPVDYNASTNARVWVMIS